MPPIFEQELASWRSQIIELRLRICDSDATELTSALWALVDVIESCIKLSGADFDAQMELVDREIEQRMRPERSPLARRLRHLRILNLLPRHSPPPESRMLKADVSRGDKNR